MSGILGIWNVDNEPVSQEILQRMSARMAHRGPDGASHLLCASAGFAFQQLKVTPESVRENQPHQSATGIVTLWDGRLDNREALIESLRSRHPVTAGSPDVELAAAAYEAFREDFAARLDGDFAVAIFDPVQQQLLLARDAIGPRPLYYCRFGSRVLFASEIKALLVHPAVQTSPNKDSLAEFLFRHWDYRDETNTFFNDIATVPPARMVIVTPARTEMRRHFEFNTSRTLRLRDQLEYVSAYQQGFFRAVKNRMRSSFPTAITVSGGLDSSSIFCTAHHLRSQETQISPFFGIGQVGTDVRGNEVEFQSAVEAHCGVSLIKQPVSALTCARDRERKAWHSEGLLLIADAWQSLYEESSRQGARTLLSGFFGDHLLMNPQYILDLLLKGKWLGGYRAYKSYCSQRWFPAEEFNLTMAELRRDLFSNLKGYMVPEALRPMYHRIRRMFAATPMGLPYFSAAFHHDYESFASRSRGVTRPHARAHVKALFHSAVSKSYKNRLERDTNAISAHRMEIAYPFFDRGLVQLVMSMPGEAVYPEGASRGIHREAMKGILPEALRVRRSKGDFTRLGRLGALQDFHFLEESLPGGAANRMGLIKPAELLRADLAALKVALQDESDANALAFWETMDLLELEAFLAVFFPTPD